MPAVLVHGVPDTPHLWDRLRARVTRADVVALRLPGFGCPVPDGFDATKEAYADWLVGKLDAIGEPVDLVGHDWGAMLVQRAASLRPELIRTLACGSGPCDVEYTWHQVAQVWQTPGAGEQLMATFTPEAAALALATELGDELARETAASVDDLMKGCILTLYRSAVHVGAEWQPGVEAVAGRFPALVFAGRDDVYVTPDFMRRLADRLHGEYIEFDCGHWWPSLRAAETAIALERLWARAG